MPQLDLISFLFILFLVVSFLFALLFRYGFPERFTFCDGLRFIPVWVFLVSVVLVMNQAGRETLDPGRWQNERLFEPVVKGEILGGEEPVKNLLFGWVLFPLRTFSKITIRVDAILTGVVVLFLAGLFLEIVGRTIARQWQSRWTLTILIGFVLLDLMTYSIIGLIRQIGWIVSSSIP
jgi:hypothetical protein